MKIDLLLPTRNRPDRLEELFNSIQDTAYSFDNICTYLYVDNDDDSTLSRIESLKKQFKLLDITFIVGERIIISKSWNSVWKESKSEIIMHCADDIRFESRNWDKIVIDTFDKSEDKILFVFGNDGITPKNHYGEGFGTHGFVSRKSTNILGYFVPPYFPCDFNDTWLNTLYGRRGWGPNSAAFGLYPDGPERGLQRKVELHDTLVTKHYHCSVYSEYRDNTESEMRPQYKASANIYFSEEMVNKRIDDIEKLKKHIK